MPSVLLIVVQVRMLDFFDVMAVAGVRGGVPKIAEHQDVVFEIGQGCQCRRQLEVAALAFRGPHAGR